ncbi:hypothetical protein Tco_0013773 [Tanacetum coccineum]
MDLLMRKIKKKWNSKKIQRERRKEKSNLQTSLLNPNSKGKRGFSARETGTAKHIEYMSRIDGRTCNIKQKCVKSQIPKRGRDTKIPQSGGPPKKVGDEAVHKELGDRMERAATTASSLEAEQDSGNINRTQSMATLNEPSP